MYTAVFNSVPDFDCLVCDVSVCFSLVLDWVVPSLAFLVQDVVDSLGSIEAVDKYLDNRRIADSEKILDLLEQNVAAVDSILDVQIQNEDCTAAGILLDEILGL